MSNPEDIKQAFAELNLESMPHLTRGVLHIVPNYVDIIQDIKFDKITNTEFQEHLDSEPFQDIYPSIAEIYDDLFNCDESWALAHCVSQDFAMFRGIALEFRRRYKEVAFLKEQRTPVGFVAALHHVNSKAEGPQGRFIFYLVTKHLYYHKPTYYHIYCCLMRLKKICQVLHINKLALPRIGSGCNRMDYRKIKHLVHMVFADSSISVRIYTKV